MEACHAGQVAGSFRLYPMILSWSLLCHAYHYIPEEHWVSCMYMLHVSWYICWLYMNETRICSYLTILFFNILNPEYRVFIISGMNNIWKMLDSSISQFDPFTTIWLSNGFHIGVVKWISIQNDTTHYAPLEVSPIIGSNEDETWAIN